MTAPTSKLGQIIKAIADRLEDEGFTVHTGMRVNPEQDELPSVSVLVHPGEGVHPQSDRVPGSDVIAARIAVEHYRDDYADDQVAFADSEHKVRSAVRQDARDYRESLGGLAHEMKWVKSVPINPETDTDVAITQILFDVIYHED